MAEGNDIPKLKEKVGKPETDKEKLIYKLALDCKTWFTNDWKAGKKYMESFLGHEIATNTYYTYLNSVDEGEHLKQWIEIQAREGFVKNHRDMMEEVTRLKDKVINLLTEELAKDDTIEIETKFGTATIANPAKSKQYIIGLMRQMTDLNKRLGELNLGSPVIATIKYMIEHNNQPVERREVPLRAVLG